MVFKVLTALALIPLASAACLEYAELMAFFESTNGKEWDRNDNWGSGDCCGSAAPWFGLKCDAVSGRISQIILPNNGLKGTLPETLDSLGMLNQLYLNQNQIEGSIPENIGNCTSLDRIYMENNMLEGTLPASLGNLTNLEHLYLASNNLKVEHHL